MEEIKRQTNRKNQMSSFIWIFENEIPIPTEIVLNTDKSWETMARIMYDEDIKALMDVLIGPLSISKGENLLSDAIHMYSLFYTSYLRAIKLTNDREIK